jgi:UDP-N-acetyl-D-mannosaminuronic acid transferase (WecB/TagA/CpsF family)
MPISMSLSAHYVTQTSVFGTAYCGPLTDRKIRRYQKLGLLGGQSTVLRKAVRKRKAAKLQTLMHQYL